MKSLIALVAFFALSSAYANPAGESKETQNTAPAATAEQGVIKEKKATTEEEEAKAEEEQAKPAAKQEQKKK